MTENYFMTSVEDAVDEGFKDGYVYHIDGPDGYQAVERIEPTAIPNLWAVICKNGKTYTRISKAPLFASTVRESGL